MTTLTNTQIAALQTKINTGDIAGFYGDLVTYGDAYGALGLGVTTNSGWEAQLSNNFAANRAADNDVDLSFGSSDWVILNTDLANRYLQGYRDNSNSSPSWDDIQNMHNTAYNAVGADSNDWLPNQLLNDSGDPSGLWNDLLVNNGTGDLFNDAWTIATSSGELLFGPYLEWLAVDGGAGINLNHVDFAKGFINALGQMDQTELQDMLGDFTGNGIITDLLDTILGLPQVPESPVGHLPPGMPDGSPVSYPEDTPIPSWLPGILNALPTAAGQSSPLVLDLDGDGVELAAVNATGSVYWNIDNDNFAEASGWIKGGDGLLAIDLNSDGVINNQSELFGNTSTFANGFAALDAYDSNNDNLITSADTQFGNLRVWIDTNSDGYSQSSELHTLSSLGITSISTTYSSVNYQIAGNDIKQESTFTINGNTRTIVDAWFTYDNVNSKYAGDYTFNLSTLFLPTLRGYGNLPDLHIAMSQDDTLLNMVKEVASTDTATIFSPGFDIQGKIEDILFRWAGVDDVSPTSRGIYIDARQLEFLEELSGKEWYNTYSSTSDPLTIPAVTLMGAWELAYDALAARLIFQATGGELFDDKPVYNVSTDEFTGTATLDFTAIGNLVSDIDNAGGKFITEWINISKYIDAIIGLGNLSPTDHSALATIINNSSSYDAVTLSNIEDAFTHQYDSSIYGDSNDNFIIGNHIYSQLLRGYGGNDVLINGGSNGTLEGGTGNDTYVFSPGFKVSGNSSPDYIYEASGEGTDTIYFAGGITPDDIRAWGGMNFISLASNSINSLQIDSITASSSDPSNIGSRIEHIIFDDGTDWDLTQGLHMTDTDSGHALYGSDQADLLDGQGGNDTIYGYGGNDIITGGTGSEYLTGGTGNDTYVFASGWSSSGSGNPDYVYEYASEGTDTIKFTGGIVASDVRMWNDSSNQVTFSLASSPSDKIQVFITASSSDPSNLGSRIEHVIFDDTTDWNLTTGLHMVDTDSGHTQYGSDNADFLDGRGGADTIYGYGGADTIYGGDGSDYIQGGDGNDLIHSGAGVDYIYGESGADTFIYEAASAFASSDTIYGFSTGAGDKIDIADVLDGFFDPLTDAITDFVHITDSGSNSIVAIDQDGTANGTNFIQIATLNNITGLTDEQALVNSGHLIVV